MTLSTLLPLCTLIAVAAAGIPLLDSGNPNPFDDVYTALHKKRICTFRYSDILLARSRPNELEPGSSLWVCNKKDPYPMIAVEKLLATPDYLKTAEYLNITANCQSYEDRSNTFGKSNHWTYSSLCTAVRTPVAVVWAVVPNYLVKPKDQKDVNKHDKTQTLLPCYVVQPQTLFDLQCVHPWSLYNPKLNTFPQNTPKQEQSRIKRYFGGIKRFKGRFPFQGIEKHYCRSGYGFDRKYVCQPTGFMKREVVVFSPHADSMFTVTVNDVPTSCQCTICKCKTPEEILMYKKPLPVELPFLPGQQIPLGPHSGGIPLGPHSGGIPLGPHSGAIPLDHAPASPNGGAIPLGPHSGAIPLGPHSGAIPLDHAPASVWT